MLSRIFTLIAFCLFLELVNITSAEEEVAKFPMTAVTDSLKSEEILSAFDYLGLKLERFSYEVPEPHSLHFTLEQFEEGEQEDVDSGGTFFLNKGKHLVTLFVYQEDDRLSFHVRIKDIHGSVSGSVGRESLEGKNAKTWSKLGNVQLIAGEKVPLYAFAANKQSITGFSSTNTVEEIVSKYELVIGIFVELELEPASTRSRPAYQSK